MLAADVSTITTLFRPTNIWVTVAPVGHDTRKLVVDGFPAQNIVASDIHHG